MATRVVIGNNKGGVGKTTLTVRLAEALAKAGRRVLVVDLDPQGNASRRLGWSLDSENPQPTISEAIQTAEEGVATQVIQPIGWEVECADRMRLCPARLELENRVSEAGTVGAHRRLVKALHGVDEGFDVTLLDCPPSLGHLTQLGMAAADHALTVTEPEYDAVEAAVRYRDFIATRAADLSNPELRLAGVVVSGFDGRIGSHVYQLDGVRALFGDLVWDPVVRSRSLVIEADENAAPLEHVKGGKASEVRGAYELLAQRLVKAVIL